MNGAAVFCMSIDKTRALFGKRRAGPNEGRWVLPGGHVNGEESLIEAAVREFYEETGIWIGSYDPGRVTYDTYRSPMAALVSPLPEHHVHMQNGRIIYFFRAAMLGSPDLSTLRHDQEFSELRFMSAKDALEEPLTLTMTEALPHLWPDFAKALEWKQRINLVTGSQP